MEQVSKEFLKALDRDLSATTDIKFTLQLAVEDDAPVELLSESSKMLERLVGHREALKKYLLKSTYPVARSACFRCGGSGGGN